ncbi:MAG: alanine--glyoxylate aminotransferase family protein [Peptococcaceae bacterium]|nr:alanine--glyoxylate aminotransferase family protein [Peptococcaceae bacterium]
MKKIMTPGPTQVRENVRMARSLATTNPDLDLEFYEYYKDTCDLLSELLHTKNVCYILSGEGILGLEAACASLTEPGDRVLVLDNGIFGKGFADFVKIYGGEPVLYSADYRREFDMEALAAYLEQNHDFKYAALVHCDTPTGVQNPIEEICPLLKRYGILSVVDAVASMFGVDINVDTCQADIVCGGSQKALSAPVGLTMVCVSDEAIRVMEQRKTPIASFYANLLTFRDYYKNKWFPYTMPISDIYGLRTALENVKADKEIHKRHADIAAATRQAVTEAGLKLYLERGYCATVTVVEVPEGVDSAVLLDTMTEKYGVMIAGCFDFLAGKVIRLGHMGENANVDDVTMMLYALECALADLGYPLKASMRDVFVREMKNK